MKLFTKENHTIETALAKYADSIAVLETECKHLQDFALNETFPQSLSRAEAQNIVEIAQHHLHTSRLHYNGLVLIVKLSGKLKSSFIANLIQFAVILILFADRLN